jgi:hypothetical protein
VLRGQIGVQVFRRAGQLAHSALEEVAGQRGLGHHQQVGRLLAGAQGAEQLPDPREILGVRPLPGLELGDGETEHARKVSGKPEAGSPLSP